VDWRSYGPVEAVSPKEAIETIAAGYRDGDLVYAPRRQGRYVAVPLDVWQDGAFEHTKAVQTVVTGSRLPTTTSSAVYGTCRY
jgi:hypothetical protein